MKNIYRVISLLLFSALIYTSCTPDEYDLGGVDVKSEDLVEGIAYKVEHDVENPNIVYLTSLMDAKYTPLWNHPQGRSQEQKVTLKMPFDGTYDVQFGVLTSGGIVYGDTTEFTIADFYAGFVDNQLWTNLTGGVGNDKTWIQDNGQYGLADGALAYGPIAYSQEFNKFTLDWQPEGNANGTTDEEMGWGSTMTFSLKDGAFLTTNKLNEGGITEFGTFLLNTDNYTLTTTDATILRPDNFIARASNWTKNIKILTLTEHQLQIAIYRDYADEEPIWLVWNYVSKDYADAYDPSSAIEPEPPYDGDANNDLTTAVTNTLTWKVDMDYPYNWQGLDGADLNTVVSYGSDPDGFSFDTWAPPYDKSILEAISITLVKGVGTGGSYAIETGAGTFDGNYIIDESNNIDFGQSIPVFTELGGWLSFGTTADNSLKIIKTETDDLGNVAGLWLGQRSEEKKEYLSIHLKPTFNSSGEVDSEVALKNIICGTTWKVDSDRSFDKTASWGAEQGPVIFSDFATWAWNPVAGDHYASGEATIDYGSMKFELDGTVSVTQHRRIYTYVDDTSGETVVRNGSPEATDVLDTDDEVTLNGTWSLDLDNNKLTMSVGAVHPWTCDYMVLDWGNLTIYRIDKEAMLLQALRDPDRSGEDAFQMTYVFVPVQ